MRKTRRPRKGSPRPRSQLPNPAPGRLKIVQDFVNTRDDDMERDELATPEALSRWLAQRKLLPALASLAEAEWRSALEVREGLRALLRTHRGLPLDDKAVDALNRALHAAHPFVSLEPRGRVAFETAEPGWSRALARIVEMAVEGIIEGHWQRLRTCHNPKCQWAFYDTSRNLAGKWCKKRRCGNRVYSKTYRRRGRSYTRGDWEPT